MVIADSFAKQISGFVGSRSDPTKKDSDNDGRQDGYGLPFQTNPYDGELDCSVPIHVNQINYTNTTLSPKPTFPTIADSDNDGASDGAEVNSYSILLNIFGDSYPIADIRSDPSRYDTDSDGLRDGLEYLFSDALNRDTDHDGIPDGTEDANCNGGLDPGETSPVVMDSDGDGLADGWADLGIDEWFGGNRTGESDGVRQSWEAVGEDLDFSGTNDPLEPSPLKWDTDGDTLSDYAEVHYLLNRVYAATRDSDADGVPDVLEKDADADGLPDNLENRDGDVTLDPDESDPYDHDTDDDSLPDGVEPSPYENIDVDNLINVNDSDSNQDNNQDGIQSFVLFRTTAKDANGDAKLDYGPGTNVSTFNVANADIYSFPANLARFSYESIGALPEGCSLIYVTNNSGNPIELRTPDNRTIYLKTEAVNKIYIEASGGSYHKYHQNNDCEISNSIHVNWVTAHSNEVSEHQISVDTRMATCIDTDFDGLSNFYDPCSTDRDTDDDGIIDGQDTASADPDADDDGLPDGLETGGISTVFGIGTAVTGTDTAATFTWTVNSVQVTVHNFTADADPSTVTGPTAASAIPRPQKTMSTSHTSAPITPAPALKTITWSKPSQPSKIKKILK
jgi:hypothetical protein